jgi:hypothetical protein
MNEQVSKEGNGLKKDGHLSEDTLPTQKLFIDLLLIGPVQRRWALKQMGLVYRTSESLQRAGKRHRVGSGGAL